MQQPQIHIRTVLAELELPDGSGQPRAFSIGYYKTNGTKDSKPAVKKGGLAGVGGGSTAGPEKAQAKLATYLDQQRPTAPPVSAELPDNTGSPSFWV